MTSISVKTSLAALVVAGVSAVPLSSAQALTGVDRGLAAAPAPIVEKAGWGCGPYGCRRWGGYGWGGRPGYWGGGYGYGYPRYYGGGYGWRPRYWGGGHGWGGPGYGWGGGYGHHW